MTKEQTNSWEEEFNKQFPNLNVAREDFGRIELYNAENNVKNFVSKTISQEREKMIEEIKKLDLYWRDKNTIFPERPTQDGLTEMVEREAVINLLQK